jgi:hypothetical protein
VSDPSRCRGGWRAWFGAALCLVAFGGLAAPSAEAKTFLRGFAEPQFDSASADRGYWFDESVRANSNLARINVSWRGITSGAPTLPANPNDPAYSFGAVDRAVLDAAGRGQRVLITVFGAPEYAEGANQPSDAHDGTWKPDPAKLGQFAEAIATRYSGNFTAIGAGPLPPVAYFEAWNEPNLSSYLTPQSINGKLYAPDRYRQMLNAFHEGVARSGSGAAVIAGATSPYGDDVGPTGTRTRPLQFLRGVFCLDGHRRPTGCKDEAQFEIVSHHPITFEKSPRYSAVNRDDVTIADFHNIVRVLHAAEKRNTVGGPNHHQAWASEFWWESKPPDVRYGIPVAKHARWLELALYLLWKQGADAAIWLRLWDDELQADQFSGEQSGIFFFDRSPKPAFTAYRFPFVVDRTSKKKVTVWAIAPADGTLEVQVQRGGDYKTIKRMSVSNGTPKHTKLTLKGKSRLRGVVAGENSLSYPAK